MGITVLAQVMIASTLMRLLIRKHNTKMHKS
ncbi:Uncharacterised protein [Vibrio cholerae]|nr:Uncharacterised protein [Vibrio cholerae]